MQAKSNDVQKHKNAISGFARTSGLTLAHSHILLFYKKGDVLMTRTEIHIKLRRYINDEISLLTYIR